MPPTPLEEFIRACRRRDPLRADGRTDAFRLLDGAGDGAAFAGLFVDDFAGRWLVQTAPPHPAPPEWLRAAAERQGAVSVYWKTLDSKEKQNPVHWAGERADAPFVIRENGLRFQIDFQAGYSQGVFLDQRDNRREVQRLASGAAPEANAVLNCFAYTCAFSASAAAGGAATVSVDLSRRYLDWGGENFRLNGLDPAAAGHEFLSGDVFEWLRRFAKRGRRFGGIVLDPPTFSRNREGKVFRVEADFGRLVELAAPLVAPGGWMLCCANQRTLRAAGFRRMIANALPETGGAWKLKSAPMPPDFTGEHYLQAVWVRT
jgi:23S rRNA (cytosine1962-C5)-methyltransferase